MTVFTNGEHWHGSRQTIIHGFEQNNDIDLPVLTESFFQRACHEADTIGPQIVHQIDTLAVQYSVTATHFKIFGTNVFETDHEGTTYQLILPSYYIKVQIQ